MNNQQPLPAFLLLFLVALFHWPAAHANESSELFSQLLPYAEAGNAEAQYHVGMMYNNGLGIKQDLNQAYTWFHKSALQSFPLAQYKIGCYLAGQWKGVVPYDAEGALQYKLLAAEAGYVLAQNDVAAIYYNKHKDPVNTMKWLHASAMQGHSKSLYNLSMSYYEGQDVKQSPVKAYAYFKLSQLAARGKINDNAQSALKQMSKDMSVDDLKNAEEMVSSWKAQPTDVSILASKGISGAKEYLNTQKSSN